MTDPAILDIIFKGAAGHSRTGERLFIENEHK